MSAREILVFAYRVARGAAQGATAGLAAVAVSSTAWWVGTKLRRRR